MVITRRTGLGVLGFVLGAASLVPFLLGMSFSAPRIDLVEVTVRAAAMALLLVGAGISMRDRSDSRSRWAGTSLLQLGAVLVLLSCFPVHSDAPATGAGGYQPGVIDTLWTMLPIWGFVLMAFGFVSIAGRDWAMVSGRRGAVILTRGVAIAGTTSIAIWSVVDVLPLGLAPLDVGLEMAAFIAAAAVSLTPARLRIRSR